MPQRISNEERIKMCEDARLELATSRLALDAALDKMRTLNAEIGIVHPSTAVMSEAKRKLEIAYKQIDELVLTAKRIPR